jgi:hypothetical protein
VHLLHRHAHELDDIQRIFLEHIVAEASLGSSLTQPNQGFQLSSGDGNRVAFPSAVGRVSAWVEQSVCVR